MSEAIKVANVDDIEMEEAIVVDPSDSGHPVAIAVFHTEDDEFYALDDVCTHEVASLADGWIEGSQVECPMHAGKFCLKTGKVLCMPATQDTHTHKVEVRDSEVWLYPGVPAAGE
ncbi:non-heme iron oxygenase ferredoxin subunit [Corynebacterium rouxii]|uniref:Non-heme iron oxygenase ferredoxin subunit n=1 Tax=Corynebacterium rouxii TaxID=2719119 RepID=A0ABU3PQT2_9CORY|nr:non-heme iron oxygenase ferredoxin subunit [Corynebacterium rouxii]MDT9409591.1 non-heme iron oxygenase ferredoxin subunit [Corynebacterium rouxii]MDT9411824.1 non-heme iron oxygenase ferredoxin subunit [Corynebacterium rouxii]